MGAWGTGPFQDDTALDWLEEPFMAKGASAVKAALEGVVTIGSDQFIDYEAGVAARAAAEVVAAAFGNPDLTNDTEDVTRIAGFAQDVRALDGIRTLAVTALARLSGANSEIADLWGESDSKDDWIASVTNLDARLRAGG